MPTGAQKFTLSGGGITPPLDGTNWFGWHQEITSTALAGGYLGLLLGTTKRPIPTRPTSIPTVKVEQQGLAATVSSSSETGDKKDAAAKGKQVEVLGDDEVVEVDAKGLVVTPDQRRQEELSWDLLNDKAMALLLRSVNDMFKWQVRRKTLASDAWASLCNAHDFSQANLIREIKNELSRFFLGEDGDMQKHLEVFGNLVLRGETSGMTDFTSDEGLRDILMESLHYDLKLHLQIRLEALPEAHRTYDQLMRFYLEYMREKKSSRLRAMEASSANILSDGSGRYDRGGRYGRGDREDQRGQGKKGGGGDRERDHDRDDHNSDDEAGAADPGKDGTCFRCGGIGHWKYECPTPADKGIKAKRAGLAAAAFGAPDFIDITTPSAWMLAAIARPTVKPSSGGQSAARAAPEGESAAGGMLDGQAQRDSTSVRSKEIKIRRSPAARRSAKGGQCWGCKMPGHERRDCPARLIGPTSTNIRVSRDISGLQGKGGQQSDGGQGRCWGCGEEGHQQKQCSAGSGQPDLAALVAQTVLKTDRDQALWSFEALSNRPSHERWDSSDYSGPTFNDISDGSTAWELETDLDGDKLTSQVDLLGEDRPASAEQEELPIISSAQLDDHQSPTRAMLGNIWRIGIHPSMWRIVLGKHCHSGESVNAGGVLGDTAQGSNCQ